MVTTRPPKTIVKPTALGPVANTDTKLLIYGLFQKGRVLAQDGSCKGVLVLSKLAPIMGLLHCYQSPRRADRESRAVVGASVMSCWQPSSNPCRVVKFEPDF